MPVGTAADDRAAMLLARADGQLGPYELTLRYQDGRDAAAAAASDAPTLFTALQEQLGLTLQPGRSPIQTVIIDRIERPTPD